MFKSLFYLALITLLFNNNLLGQGKSLNNIKYADASPSETLDIFLSGDNEKGVCVVLIGTPYWSKNLVQLFNNNGYDAITVNYRDSKEYPFPAQIQDIQAALKWIKANSRTYNYNPRKIILCGAGEGGYLASLAAAIESYSDGVMAEIEFGSNPEELKAQNLLQNNVNWINLFSLFPGAQYNFNRKVLFANPKVAGVIDFYGYTYNMGKIDISNSGLNAKEAKTQTSVAQYITPCTPPMLFIYGEDDKIVPFGAGENLFNKLRTKLCPPGTNDCAVKFISVPGGVHGGVLFESQYINNNILEFIEKIIK